MSANKDHSTNNSTTSSGWFRMIILDICHLLDGKDRAHLKARECPEVSEEELREVIPTHCTTEHGNEDNSSEEDNSESQPSDSVSLKAIAATVALSLQAIPWKASAQDAVGFINETHSQIISIGSVLYQVVVAIMGIIALISLITLAIRIQNSDREGASKATGWFAIMIFCIVMCVVIKNYMGF